MAVKGNYIYVSNRYGFQIAKVSGGKLQFVKNIVTAQQWHGSIATQGNRFLFAKSDNLVPAFSFSFIQGAVGMLYEFLVVFDIGR